MPSYHLSPHAPLSIHVRRKAIGEESLQGDTGAHIRGEEGSLGWEGGALTQVGELRDVSPAVGGRVWGVEGGHLGGGGGDDVPLGTQLPQDGVHPEVEDCFQRVATVIVPGTNKF